MEELPQVDAIGLARDRMDECRSLIEETVALIPVVESNRPRCSIRNRIRLGLGDVRRQTFRRFPRGGLRMPTGQQADRGAGQHRDHYHDNQQLCQGHARGGASAQPLH